MKANYIQKTITTDTATIWLNRPNKGNAFNDTMISELQDILEGVENDPSVRFIILRAKGKHFCVGADLEWMAKSAELSYEENLSGSLELAGLFERIFYSRKVFFASVHGACYGGGIGLAAACDFVFADHQATFSFGEVRLGLIPATIAPFVMNRVGYQQAKRYMLSGEIITSEKALNMNLADEVFNAEKEDAYLEQMLEKLHQGGPNAQKGIKDLMNYLTLPDYKSQLKTHTAEIIAKARSSEEGQEGIDAFFAKRKANWSI